MVTDNEIAANTQTERVVQRAERLRKVLDRQLEAFAEAGGLRRLGGPGGEKIPAGGGGQADGAGRTGHTPRVATRAVGGAGAVILVGLTRA